MDKEETVLKKLAKLDYDAAGAYDEAIRHIDDLVSKGRLAEYRDDHLRHTENVGGLCFRRALRRSLLAATSRKASGGGAAWPG